MDVKIISRHDRLKLLEVQITARQATIEECMTKLTVMRDQAEELIEKASVALEERDRLLVQVEDEGLWVDDYESAEDYFDSIGLSRQRSKQIRDRVKLNALVHSVDKMLPPVSDLQARELGQLDDENALHVYEHAVKESGGESPPPSRIKFLVKAVQFSVEIDSEQMLREYEDNVLVDKINKLFSQLSDSGKHMLVSTLIERVAYANWDTGGGKASPQDAGNLEG